MAEIVGTASFTTSSSMGQDRAVSPIDKRIVVFLAIAEFQILDLAGPYEVFEGANTALRAQGRAGGYQLVVASSTPRRVATSGGLGLHADTLPEPDRALDTLVIPGGNGPREVSADSTSAIWVRQVAPHCRRIATVCTGAFVAGRAGLLVGRTVATHWFRTQQLQAEFPDTVVDPDRLYLRDGELWSSGGVTAGVDLALALVEDDHDAELAQLVARHLVLSWRRPGGQSQYAVPMWAPRGTTPPVVHAQQLIDADPSADHRAGVLAAAVGLSERHLGRLFTAEIGEPPARYVERLRLQNARTLLENENNTVSAIAARCGFGTSETMRRTFVRRLGVPPEGYRDRFNQRRRSA